MACRDVEFFLFDVGGCKFVRPASPGTLQLRPIERCCPRAVLGFIGPLKLGQQSNQSIPESWGHIWGHVGIRKFRKALCGNVVLG